MSRSSLSAVLVVVCLGACASTDSRTARSDDSLVPSPASPSLITEMPPRAPIRLPKLPRTGLAVSYQHATALIDLHGNLIGRLSDAVVSGNTGARGTWFKGRHVYYALDLRRDLLRPVAREVAESRMYDEDQPHLPLPPHGGRYKGKADGVWRYAFTRSDGTRLAQWSGECETPIAYWVTPDGREQIITGETTIADAPESVALGWSRAGDALVLLPQGACGTTHDPPGIYAFAEPGQGRLIYRVEGFASAKMWRR